LSKVPEPHGEGKHITSTDLTRKLRIERALHGVEQLRQHALEIEAELGGTLQRTSPLCRESAFNLAHYLAVRQADIRSLQSELSRLGLSSLGAIEGHVMASLNAVLRTLHVLDQRSIPTEMHQEPLITFEAGQSMLDRNTEGAFWIQPGRTPCTDHGHDA
jgi:pyruvate kinase